MPPFFSHFIFSVIAFSEIAHHARLISNHQPKVGTIQNPIQKNWFNPIQLMSNHIHNHNPTFQKGLLSNPIPNPNPKYPESSLPLRHRYYRLQWHPVTVIVLTVLKWFVYILSTDHLSDQVILSISHSLRLFCIAKWMDLDWQSNPSASIPQSLQKDLQSKSKSKIERILDFFNPPIKLFRPLHAT